MAIVINEYDKTKAAASEYANFAVLIPGAVASGKGDCFDDNDIYECASQADFEDKIGLAQLASFSVGEKVEAKACEAEAIEIGDGDYYEIEPDIDVYTREELKDANSVGRLISYDAGTKKYYKYTYLFHSDGHGLFSKNETYYRVTELGQDAQEPTENDTQIGNQIAYELLGLGYTVYYKKIDADTNFTNIFAGLEDKANYDFRYIMSGFIDPSDDIQKAMMDLANTRQDCIALLDIKRESYKNKSLAEKVTGIANYVNGCSDAGKNCAFFAPSVTYSLQRSAAYKEAYVNNYKFPASFHYLACAAKSSERYAEWYANSGYTRGISDFNIASVDAIFGEAAIEKLQPRAVKDGIETKHAVNLIAKFRDQYLLWGNRTAYVLRNENSALGDLVASDFLNIRQLCCTLKKQIYVACRQLSFDPNSNVLWFNFKNKIRPILEKMKTDQGIEDYEFVKIETDKKATLKAQIRIIPIEAVEDFNIDVMLEDNLEGVVIGDTDNSENE